MDKVQPERSKNYTEYAQGGGGGSGGGSEGRRDGLRLTQGPIGGPGGGDRDRLVGPARWRIS